MPSGAARGQSGGGFKAGNSRNPYDAYKSLTPEEKRQKAKEKRMAMKDEVLKLEPELFQSTVRNYLNRLEYGF